MASPSKIRVMISSRCDAPIDFRGSRETLSVVRKELKSDLEKFKLPNQSRSVFDCWINEDSTAAPGSQDWWDHCLLQATEADLVIVLYSGSAGDGLAGSDMGICHAELMAAMEVAADRVRVIKLPAALMATDQLQQKRDKNFKEYFDSLGHFRSTANDEDDVLNKVWNEINKALVDFVQQAVRVTHLSQASTGQALDWKRLDYGARKSAMENVMTEALLPYADNKKTASGVLVKIAGKPVLVKSHAIPASISQPAAREKVGQPFLNDHLIVDEMRTSKAGPIHIIAIPKGVTESQATKLLGFPDATIVSDSFGIHVVDNIQKIQLVLLKGCVSPSAIRGQIADWIKWLKREREDQHVLKRAQARCRIVEAIAREVTP